MASLYFSMMSSGLRQFLARPISALVSALIPLEVRAPGTEQGQKWAQGLLANAKYLKSKLGYAVGLTQNTQGTLALSRKKGNNLSLSKKKYICDF